MKRTGHFGLLLLAGLAACTPNRSERMRGVDDDGSTARADVGFVDGGAFGDAGEKSDAGQDAADGGSERPFCRRRCSTPVDCVAPGAVPAFDTDNYACVDGVCDYLGCRNDAECVATYSDVSVCRPAMNGVPKCVTSCTVDADCSTQQTTSGAFDADNYVCREHQCVYLGCLSDDECETSYPEQRMACHPAGGNAFPYCSGTGCSTASDCAVEQISNGLYGADNYECRAGFCEWLGCRAESECEASIGMAREGFICR